MTLTQISARFFLELAVGLLGSLCFLRRDVIGPGFTRLVAACALGCAIPAALLARGMTEAVLPIVPILLPVFLGACLLLLVATSRFDRVILYSGVVAGVLASLTLIFQQFPERSVANVALNLAGGLSSAGILGFVVGAMLLGHWYLVTPELDVKHLGSITRFGLAALYSKAILLALTVLIFRVHFEGPARSIAVVMGLSDSTGTSFQSQVDFIFLLARVAIGLIGPIALCHMTLATVKLKATQPATGILYAATVMVLMGEFLGYYAERGFGVVL